MCRAEQPQQASSQQSGAQDDDCFCCCAHTETTPIGVVVFDLGPAAPVESVPSQSLPVGVARDIYHPPLSL